MALFPQSPFPETPRSCLYLHNAADDHGEDIQGEAEDVEQGQGHEGLLGIQDVVLIDCHVDGKRRQGHLQADKVSISVTKAVTHAPTKSSIQQAPTKYPENELDRPMARSQKSQPFPPPFSTGH